MFYAARLSIGVRCLGNVTSWRLVSRHGVTSMSNSRQHPEKFEKLKCGVQKQENRTVLAFTPQSVHFFYQSRNTDFTIQSVDVFYDLHETNLTPQLVSKFTQSRHTHLTPQCLHVFNIRKNKSMKQISF
jgi:hypothetical protein